MEQCAARVFMRVDGNMRFIEKKITNAGGRERERSERKSFDAAYKGG